MAKQYGQEVSFRRGDGVTKTARVGSPQYKKLEANPAFVRTTKSTEELKEDWSGKVDLTLIDGIGAVGAEALVEGGFMTIKQVAESNAAEIAEKTGLSDSVAGKAHASAVELAAKVDNE